MNRIATQAAARLSAAALALLVTVGTLVTLDTLAYSQAAQAAQTDVGTLVQATPAAPRG